ncbi:AraC family transcriptional regulator [Ruminococcaceae bacterium OttesenSCG-928-L11]|nr:AraC family transcriptional regulator [Ruminococcaceae bacterium OttesenSCG-928-L11]
MEKLKEGSVWYIAHPDSFCEMLALIALESGKFIVDNTTGSIHCGRNDYMLLFSSEGDGEIHYEKHKVSLPAQTITFVDCRKPYSLKCARNSAKPWTFFWVRFRGSACDFFYEKMDAGSFTEHHVENPEDLHRAYEQVLELFNLPGVEVFFRLSNSISRLLTAYLNLSTLKSPKYLRHQQTISKATEFIKENYNRQLDIEQLAGQAGLSKFYFIKLFKEFMHIAPYEYIIVYRINEAKKFLRLSNLKVSQVSEAVGFNDECNFIRTFKRITGFTPLQYRDNQR